jgi:hypothetical protein
VHLRLRRILTDHRGGAEDAELKGLAEEYSDLCELCASAVKRLEISHRVVESNFIMLPADGR